MSRLLSLPFGQADCFLLELQKGGSSPGYVLIDGGRKETQYPPLMDYLQKLGIPSIDLLILTHLHGDHLGWLDQVVLSVPVTEAVLPYGPLGLDSDYLEREGMEREFCQTVMDYRRLIKHLKRQDTVVHTAFQGLWGEEGRKEAPFVFSFGSYTLRELFPADLCHGTTAFEEFCLCAGQCRPGTVRDAWSRAARYLNGDSSVWLLNHGTEAAALFCGDIFESSLQAAMERAGFTGSVPLIKLSHHGRNDKGHVYFTPDFINSLSPETIIITNTDDNCRLYGTRWNDFWKGCSVLATGSLHAIWEGVLCVPI